jgi:hypothetical protein
MPFILSGFTQNSGCRVFTFECIGPDRSRTKYTVRADLSLIRTYGIQIQELPLLCRGLLDRQDLDRQDKDREKRSVTFSEEEMRACANERATARAEAEKKRRAPRRPSGENLGTAWRVQHT